MHCHCSINFGTPIEAFSFNQTKSPRGDSARSSVTNLTQTIELFDFAAGVYVAIDTRTATTTDSVVEVMGSNPSRFVQTGTRAIRAKVSRPDF